MDDTGSHAPFPAEAHAPVAAPMDDIHAKRAIFWMLFVLVWVAILPLLPMGLWVAFPAVLIIPVLVSGLHFRREMRRMMRHPLPPSAERVDD